MNKQERIAALQAVNDVADYETEQSAIDQVCTVDMLPTIPAGAVDLFHRFDDREALQDYTATCKALGLAFDRGARRYCFDRRKQTPRKVYDALQVEGFVVCVRPGLLD